ncbi:DUF4625 domain-containing protein [Pedobacter frigoris]|uniref:DUF4625 domain-containing protein n=1 Tax=Pedobacter frigoris TaxID=2571272 RepID=A0A4U1CMJ5_9SPHI|nr:DUF4625 domain-containing protein [Pedobacter frigoris]TKC08623.1 DUF4625 domain-containing protein [Pedobacter frigoris]
MNTSRISNKYTSLAIRSMKIIVALIIIMTTFQACKKDKEAEPEKSIPTATNVEIGSGNKLALRGRDFHFNADVVAATKIKDVQVKILQKSSEKYTAPWKFELNWAEYKSAKNTNVHKHFTIPAEAPEGKYDFYFIVLDENGTKLEIKEDLSIIDPVNVPVDPKIGRDIISRNGTMIYYTNTFVEPELIVKKGDELTLHAQVSDIKGDGILYSILIKKSANYNPESIDNLNLSKAIVVTKVTHTGLAAASKVSTLKQVNGVYGGESIKIGADKDNNEPAVNPIDGDKAWESGKYNWVILYKNTTHNVSSYKVIPITIDFK